MTQKRRLTLSRSLLYFKIILAFFLNASQQTRIYISYGGNRNAYLVADDFLYWHRWRSAVG
jgi:hypothetical protein